MHGIIDIVQRNTDARAGFMGTAIVKGLMARVQTTGGRESRFTLLVRSKQSLTRLRQALRHDQNNISYMIGEDKIVEAVESANVVLLGFTPDLIGVLRREGVGTALTGKIVISLLAGASYAQLSDVITNNSNERQPHQLVRAIPSLGASINHSVTLWAENKQQSCESFRTAAWIFE